MIETAGILAAIIIGLFWVGLVLRKVYQAGYDSGRNDYRKLMGFE